ncbi:MAG: class I SAM-dependent methyltransferase [Candidatus Binatia bacterium]
MDSDDKRFHDYSHALEYDQRAARSDVRAQLAPRVVEALELRSHEWLLDLATGTGRFARPVAKQLKGGRMVGLDEALAMLRVAQEQREKEPIPGFLAVVGAAEEFPFRAEVFDRVFTVFALHHFGHPSKMIREVHRVLNAGGSFVVLDPIVPTAENALDTKIHELINEILRRAHGRNFHYYSAEDIRDLLAQGGLRILRADSHTFSVDQEGMEGIPTGRHWIEIAEQIQGQSAEIRRRFEERYFRYEKKGEEVHIRGSFAYALVSGQKS